METHLLPQSCSTFFILCIQYLTKIFGDAFKICFWQINYYKGKWFQQSKITFWFGDSNWANTCPWACHKKQLINGYELSYTTGSLYVGTSCLLWGVWVGTVWHRVVQVLVMYCSKGGWVRFLYFIFISLLVFEENQRRFLVAAIVVETRASCSSLLASHNLIFFPIR